MRVRLYNGMRGIFLFILKIKYATTLTSSVFLIKKWMEVYNIFSFVEERKTGLGE